MNMNLQSPIWICHVWNLLTGFGTAYHRKRHRNRIDFLSQNILKSLNKVSFIMRFHHFNTNKSCRAWNILYSGFNLILCFILKNERKLALKIEFWELQLPLVRDQTELWKNQNKIKPQVAMQLPGAQWIKMENF